MKNEWWKFSVTLNAHQAHSRDEVGASLLKRLSWSLGMTSELVEVDVAYGFWRQGGMRWSFWDPVHRYRAGRGMFTGTLPPWLDALVLVAGQTPTQ